MATKKDLIEAEGFSRRRLLSAFTGGAPGGKELEPAAPLRAVAAGIALTAMLILGGVFYGLVKPGLPSGWQNDRLILVSDTGARYMSVKGVLYPVINTASARLLVPADKYKVITTDEKTLSGIKIGPSIGILGAPDDLPQASTLVGSGWSACQVGTAKTAVAISDSGLSAVNGKAVVVSVGRSTYVIAGRRRYAVAGDDVDSVLRAVGLDTSDTKAVDGRWLNLFTPGAALAPITVAGAGSSVAGSDLTVGSVVHPTGAAADQRYLVTASGDLSPVSPLAYQLYLLGTGAKLGGAREVTPAQISALPTSKTAAGSASWPTATLSATPSGSTDCALLGHSGSAPTTTLTVVPAGTALPSSAQGVKVTNGSGALVRTGPATAGMVYLIDGTGTAFAVPGATPGVVARLGYSESDIAQVPQTWIDFLPTGPALTVAAAGSSPSGSAAAATK
jgi:type VII secretion protein EccB